MNKLKLYWRFWKAYFSVNESLGKLGKIIKRKEKIAEIKEKLRLLKEKL